MGRVEKIGFENMDEKERVPLSPEQNSGKCKLQTYQSARGFSRYSNALKNLIPIRREAKETGVMTVDSVGLFSFITFSWLSKLLYKAHREEIMMEDIPVISPYDACSYNVDRLELLWEKELASHGPEKASLSRVIWIFSRTRIIASSACYIASLVFACVNSSLLMRKLLEYVQSKDGNYLEGIKWASLLTIAELFRMIIFTGAWSLNYRTALRVRSACFMLLYKNIIRLNNSGDNRIGQMINMFSNDAERLFVMIITIPMILGGPFLTVYAMFFVVWQLSPIALLGIGAFFLFYPFQYLMARVIEYLGTKRMKISDERLRFTNEILDCIKLIKMYAWEERFSRDLENIRNKELGFLFKASYWQISNQSITPNVPIISAMITFIAFLSVGNNLTAAMVFPYIAFLDARFGFSLIFFLHGIGSIVTARISLNRIKSILILESRDSLMAKPILKSQAIAISYGTLAYDTFDDQNNGSFRKEESERKNLDKNLGGDVEREKLNNPLDDHGHVQVLFDISFEATKGKLVGICGHVGSGKSSLLLAALGQLKVLEGKVMRDGSVAYVSQQAWIINATLRENILFGTPYDHERYHKAIHASSLIQDIGIMPAGDQTEIGEKGVNLSGGQKQRLALARALYADRDIYFLDDPLSAVDSRVGSDIFDNYILGALSGKTVLFVTHQIQYLNRCDDIYMMSDGRIIEHGTHNELMKLGNKYAAMVSSISANNTNAKTNPADIDPEISMQVNENVASDEKNEKVNSEINPENTPKLDNPGASLTIPDELQRGTIKAQTYRSYVMAGGGYCSAFFIMVTFFVIAGSTAFGSWWLAIWISAGGGNTTIVRNNATAFSDNINDNPDYWYYQTIYGSSVGVILLSIFVRSFVFTKATTKASTELHNDLFAKIINSPMRFFDTTPSGRIQHLFSRDMDDVDNRLPPGLMDSMQYLFILLFAVLAVCVVFPWLILLLLVFGACYYYISTIFRAAVRDLRRIENKSRGPVISFVTATIQGLSTIRAFEKEADFKTKFADIFNENSKCVFASYTAMRWLSVRVEIMAVIVVSITAFMVVGLKGQVSAALGGLALSYAANIAGVLQFATRLLSETEVQFISVEKINHYIRTLIGEGKTSQPNVEPPTTWPVTAEIKFKNVSMTYGDNAPLILKNVSFSVNAGEKIGIVGRTGSGKSSLTVALFRLVELAEGKIGIDDVDISKISLKQLRTKISIIPQDPILFSGSIRSNLDPFKLHTDAELWDALEKTKLKSRVQSIAGQLEASVGFGGDSLSIGERQLFCLTRALLRDTKILVLDEATAAVDTETEIAVQNMIQEEFSECTVLTIAHRLQTVLPLDRILVMDDGKVLEFDTPSNLLADNNSEFSKMLATAEKAVNK